jgi:hypothetical protein
MPSAFPCSRPLYFYRLAHSGENYVIKGMAPYLWILGFTVLVFLPGMAMAFGRGGRDSHGHRVFRVRPIRRLFGLMLVALAGVSALLAASLVQFFRLTSDTPLLHVSIVQHAPQQFALTASTPDAQSREYDLRGDEWQVDAQIVRWRLPALLAGVPPLYRFERISGRYLNASQEQTAIHTVYDFDDSAMPDLSALAHRLPNWLNFVDVQFGSATYMPLFDGAQYEIFMDPRGALFARPEGDKTTAALKQRAD